MTATACPYAFPFLWHRTMAQIIEEELCKDGAVGCLKAQPGLNKERAGNTFGEVPGPDQETCYGGSSG